MFPETQPAISVILITHDCYDSLQYVVRALRYQSIRELVEVIIVGPFGKDMMVKESDLDNFAAYQIVETGRVTSNATARAAGIKTARAPIIAFMEDHCFPSETLCEALVRRHQQSWSGAGPVFLNANPQTAISWAHFLIEYGAFAAPLSHDNVRHMPGHNSSYKRDALLEYGENLDLMLESESPMQWDMQKRGHRFCLEPEAKMFHFNFSTLQGSFMLRFQLGRLFAAHRSRQWPIWRRWIYNTGSPLLPCIKLLRSYRIFRRIGPPGGFIPILPMLLLLLLCDATGEMLGYFSGAGNADRYISDFEVNRDRYLNSSDRQRFHSEILEKATHTTGK